MKNQGKTLAQLFPEKVTEFEGQKFVEAVSLSEFVKRLAIQSWMIRDVFSAILDYTEALDQAPSPESLEGCSIVWVDKGGVSHTGMTFVADYKTIEQAINDGIKIYIKID